MTERNHTLDAVRGVAAIAVVVLHLHGAWGRQIAPSGYLAVDLFFVLSGVVIASSYDPRLKAGMTPIKFLLLRLARFYPLYALGLLLGVVQFAVHAGLHAHEPWALKLAGQTALSFFFVPFPLVDQELFPLNLPAWSLFFELVVNLLYALFFPLLRRLAVIALISALSLAGLVVLGAEHGSLLLGPMFSTFAGGFLRATFAFPVGVLIHRLGIKLRMPVPLVLVACALLLVASPPAPLRLAYDIFCVVAAFPILVAAAQGSSAPRLVPAFAWLGTTSYCIYVVHYPLVKLAGGLLKHGAEGAVVGIALLLILFVLCPVLDAVFDAPARKALTAFVKSLTADAPGEPAKSWREAPAKNVVPVPTILGSGE